MKEGKLFSKHRIGLFVVGFVQTVRAELNE
jgi:hypothetical protein